MRDHDKAAAAARDRATAAAAAAEAQVGEKDAALTHATLQVRSCMQPSVFNQQTSSRTTQSGVLA